MATRLSSRSTLLTTNMFKKLTELDVMCPVCRGIFIEPVILPCYHGLCLQCIRPTMAETSLTCPMCRKRVGSWLRSATNDRNLVNDKLWDAIKKRFPEKVKAKLNGEDDGLEERLQNTTPAVQFSLPGAIRREFDQQRKLLEEEARRKYEKECKVSEDLIRKMQEKELDEIRASMQSQLEADEQVARQLQEQAFQEKERLEKKHEEAKAKVLSQVGTDEQVARQLQEQAMQSTSTITRRDVLGKENKNRVHTPVTKGPLDNYLKSTLGTTNNSSNIKMGFPVIAQERARSSSNLSSASHDSINQEMLHFKPIKIVPRTPPKRLPDGRLLEPKLIKTTPVNLSQVYEAVEAGQPIESLLSSSMRLKLLKQQEERLEVSNCTTAMELCSSQESAFKGISLGSHMGSDQSSEKSKSLHKGVHSDDSIVNPFLGVSPSSSGEAPNPGQKVIAVVHSHGSDLSVATGGIGQAHHWRFGSVGDSSNNAICEKSKKWMDVDNSREFVVENEESDDSDTDFQPEESDSASLSNSESSELHEKGRMLSSSLERQQDSKLSPELVSPPRKCNRKRSKVNNKISLAVTKENKTFYCAGKVMEVEGFNENADMEAARLVTEEQARIEMLMLQERADLELAIQLSNEWNEVDRRVDRRKGTSNAYALRNNSNTNTIRNRVVATKTSTKRMRGGRQKTLEEAFSSPVRTRRR